MRTFDVNKFWNFISSFFSFLNDKSKNVVENFWHGLHLTGEYLVDRASDFKNAQAPEYTNTDVKENYYEILVSPLSSILLKLDPSDSDSQQVITPKSRISIEPLYASGLPIYQDMIEIGAKDYYTIRNIGIGMYAVIVVKRPNIANQFFKIKNLRSSEEVVGSGRYYYPERTVGGIPDPASYKYIIELDNADLSYIGDNSFSLYLTSGRSYMLSDYVLSVPNLQTEIGVWDGKENENLVQLQENVDYIIQNEIIEFLDDIFASNLVIPGQSLYCKWADIIEQNLYTTHGTLVNIPDYTRYNYNTISGKASINALLKSLQNTTTLSDYQKSLSIYYGLPVAPQNCKVVGLYESYGYAIDDIVGSNITLRIKDHTTLHNFIQVGTKLRTERTGKEITVNSVINRVTGVITVDDSAGLLFSDTLNVKLQNRYSIISMTKETIGVDGMIQIGSAEAFGKIQHIINIVQSVSNTQEFPEVLIYGTGGFSINYDGIYHITNSELISPGIIGLSVYNPVNDYEPKYNDYISASSAGDMGIGFLHIPWPTHKYLLLLLEDGTYFKAYIDSPLDTIYSEGNFIEKYAQLCRSVSVINNTIFPYWNSFDGFKRYNGIDAQSSIVEIMNINKNVGFGAYFPSEYRSLI
jgi:hypothetical protein